MWDKTVSKAGKNQCTQEAYTLKEIGNKQKISQSHIMTEEVSAV
jgi:hypothetical protein